MTTPPDQLLRSCLFFTAGSLSRAVTRMAEDAFRPTGLGPSQAFLLLLSADRPGSRQKELGEGLHLAPSTVTRMVDSLVRDGLLEREVTGREALVKPTAAGRRLVPKLRRAWRSLYDRYSEILGEDAGAELTRLAGDAADALTEGE